MQELLNVCSNYKTEHSLLYNANKSYSLCFKATTIKLACRYLGITISAKKTVIYIWNGKGKIVCEHQYIIEETVSLVFGIGGVISCLHNYSIVLCIKRYFMLYLIFLNINLYIICIFCKFCKFLFGLRFQNKYIISE